MQGGGFGDDSNSLADSPRCENDSDPFNNSWSGGDHGTSYIVWDSVNQKPLRHIRVGGPNVKYWHVNTIYVRPRDPVETKG